MINFEENQLRELQFDLKGKIRDSISQNILHIPEGKKQQISAWILQLEPKERREEDILALKTFTQKLDFFQQINQKRFNQESKLDEKICRRMKYQKLTKGQVAIEYGAMADKFFIILKGQVDIFLAKSQDAIEVEEQQLKGRKMKFTPINFGQNDPSNMSHFNSSDSIQKNDNQDILSNPSDDKKVAISYKQKTQTNGRQKIIEECSKKIKNFHEMEAQLLNKQKDKKDDKEGEYSSFHANTSFYSILEHQAGNQLNSSDLTNSKDQTDKQLICDQIKIETLYKSNFFPPPLSSQQQKCDLKGTFFISNNAIDNEDLLSVPKIIGQQSYSLLDSPIPSRPKSNTQQNPELNFNNFNFDSPTLSFEKKNPQKKYGTPELSSKSRQISSIINIAKSKQNISIIRWIENNNKNVGDDSLNCGNLRLKDIENVENYCNESGLFKFAYTSKLGVGCTFGELGLLEDKPRSAMIICSQDCEFAIMEKTDYSELLAERDRKHLEYKFNFLKERLFPNLTNDAIKKIFYSFKKRSIKRNEHLFSEGEESNGLFIIKKGEIALSKKKIIKELGSNQFQVEYCGGDKEQEKEANKNDSLFKKQIRYAQKTFAIIGRGEYFGEEDLLKNSEQKRTFTATCISLEGSVYFIESPILLKFLKQKPTSQFIIEKRLDRKIKWRQILEQNTHEKAVLRTMFNQSQSHKTLINEQKEPNLNSTFKQSLLFDNSWFPQKKLCSPKNTIKNSSDYHPFKNKEFGIRKSKSKELFATQISLNHKMSSPSCTNSKLTLSQLTNLQNNKSNNTLKEINSFQDTSDFKNQSPFFKYKLRKQEGDEDNVEYIINQQEDNLSIKQTQEEYTIIINDQLNELTSFNKPIYKQNSISQNTKENLLTEDFQRNRQNLFTRSGNLNQRQGESENQQNEDSSSIKINQLSFLSEEMRISQKNSMKTKEKLDFFNKSVNHKYKKNPYYIIKEKRQLNSFLNSSTAQSYSLLNIRTLVKSDQKKFLKIDQNESNYESNSMQILPLENNKDTQKDQYRETSPNLLKNIFNHILSPKSSDQNISESLQTQSESCIKIIPVFKSVQNSFQIKSKAKNNNYSFNNNSQIFTSDNASTKNTLPNSPMLNYQFYQIPDEDKKMNATDKSPIYQRNPAFNGCLKKINQNVDSIDSILRESYYPETRQPAYCQKQKGIVRNCFPSNQITNKKIKTLNPIKLKEQLLIGQQIKQKNDQNKLNAREIMNNFDIQILSPKKTKNQLLQQYS